MKIIKSVNEVKEYIINNRPYGAWISNDSIYFVEASADHEYIALNILEEKFIGSKKKFKYNKGLGLMISKKYSVYKIMWRLHFVRVVFKYRTQFSYNVNYWMHAELSDYQKSFINSTEFIDLQHIYGWEFYKLLEIRRKKNDYLD